MAQNIDLYTRPGICLNNKRAQLKYTKLGKRRKLNSITNRSANWADHNNLIRKCN